MSENGLIFFGALSKHTVSDVTCKPRACLQRFSRVMQTSYRYIVDKLIVNSHIVLRTLFHGMNLRCGVNEAKHHVWQWISIIRRLKLLLWNYLDLVTKSTFSIGYNYHFMLSALIRRKMFSYNAKSAKSYLREPENNWFWVKFWTSCGIVDSDSLRIRLHVRGSTLTKLEE